MPFDSLPTVMPFDSLPTVMPFDSLPTVAPRARPLVKWTGGKGGELPAIMRAMPTFSGRLLEPFLGGGAVSFAMPAHVRVEANDRSEDLVSLYACMTSMDPTFVAAVEAIDAAWRAIERCLPWTASVVEAACRPLAAPFGSHVPKAAADAASIARARKTVFLEKLRAKRTLEGDGAILLASATKSGVYHALRSAYNAARNGPARAAAFWFLRDFCYGGMFRTNGSGGFNVPYGGVSYDTRGMKGRLVQMRSAPIRARLANTAVHQGDFQGFLEWVRPTADDFMFLDPPYDSPFSTYDGNSFGRDDHRRLAAAMSDCQAKWMLVVSKTEFIVDTYCSLPQARTTCDDKIYNGSIKGRYDRKAVHLRISNFDA